MRLTADDPKAAGPLFPLHSASGGEIATAAQDRQTVSGHYVVSRRSQNTIVEVGTVLGEAKVYGNRDGTISVDALKDLNGQPKRFREIAPLMFREVNGQDRVAFKRDASEQLVMVIDFPFMVFERTPWNWNSALNLPLIISCLVVFLVTLLLWPIGAMIRRHYGRKLELTPQQRRVRLMVRLVCALDLIFVVCLPAPSPSHSRTSGC